jgi:hypothetical protein
MAVYLTNNFEEGTSGTTISTGNSAPPAGAGNAFDVVNIGSGAALTFDNAEAAHGTLSAKFVEPAVATSCYLQWSTSLTATTLNQIWFRVYCYFPTYSLTLRLVEIVNGTTFCGAVSINATGHVLTQSSVGGATQTTSTLAMPTSQWYRLEGYFIGSATVGQIQVKIFTTSPDELNPDETDTTPATVNTNSALTGIRFGNPSSVASYTFWLDDLGASDTGYLGPSQLSGSGSGAVTLAATATGSSQRSGSSSGAVSLAANATGSSRRTGAVTGAVALKATATTTRDISAYVSPPLSKWILDSPRGKWSEGAPAGKWDIFMMANQVINSLSTEYVQVSVQVQVGGTIANPTGDTVQFAFVPGSAYPVTWYAGSWITTVQGDFIAQCLVGPENSGVVLAPGMYTVWVQITDSPEVPIKPAGSLAIT